MVSDDHRRHARTQLFVAATLYAENGSTPVNIRNMSQCGAMVEAQTLPDVGEKILLRRGHLATNGWITWRAGQKAGIMLDVAIHVTDWMLRRVSAAQQHVDNLVSTARGQSASFIAPNANDARTQSIEIELTKLRQELSDFEAELVKDVILVATHPEIQVIDIALQRIDRILNRLRDK